MQKTVDSENKHIESQSVRFVEKNILKNKNTKNSVQINVSQNIEELIDWIILKQNVNYAEKNLQKINMQKKYTVQENVLEKIEIISSNCENVYDLSVE